MGFWTPEQPSVPQAVTPQPAQPTSFWNKLKKPLQSKSSGALSNLQAPTLITIPAQLTKKTIIPKNTFQNIENDIKNASTDFWGNAIQLGNNVIENVKNPKGALNKVAPNKPLIDYVDGKPTLNKEQADKVMNTTLGLTGGADFVSQKLGGKIPRSILNFFSKETKPITISDSIQKVYGVEKSIADDLGSKLAPTKSVDEVKQVLTNYEKSSPSALQPRIEGITEGIQKSQNAIKEYQAMIDNPASDAETIAFAKRRIDGENKFLEKRNIPNDTLTTEARKYKSAEEFVKAQRKMYRGTATPQSGDLDVANTYGLAYGKGAYLASDESFAKSYGENISELYPVLKKPWVMDKEVPKNVIAEIKKDFPDYSEKYGTTGEDVHAFFGNQDDANKYLQKLGYDGLLDAASGGSKQTIVFDPKNIKTKSQLTDIYNKAVGERKPSDMTREELDTQYPQFKSKFPSTKEVSQIDQLIADNKIRVVSRDGRDVYQYQKGKQWVNARDEDSAIKKVTALPKAKTTEQAQIQEKKDLLNYVIDDTKDRIKNHPGKILQRFESKKEGQLLDSNKNFAKAAENLDVKEFDNSDEASRLIDEYRELKTTLVDLQAQKKTLKISAEGIPLSTAKPKVKSSLSVPKQAPLIDTTTGQGRSLEIVADQALKEIDPTLSKDVYSLPEIIEQVKTPVNKKITVWDYVMRTPDRVMQKIGLGKEMEMLRKGYESYLTELPKNLNTIGDWSKAVPKESNKRIFKYLDGEAIDLTPTEKKVAGEIQAWLANWAQRLGLPKDNTIARYITHIFDKELLAKEFDEDLAKIIADKIPGQVYDPFLEKRLGAKGYKQDTWAALDAYVKRATRKVNMDPALEAIKEKAGGTLEYAKIEESQWKYLQNYINGVNMRPTSLDNLIDNSIKNIVGYKFGQRPLTSLTKALRQLTFRGALGLNLGSALRNISQGINTFAKLGPKYTALGYLNLYKIVPGMKKGALDELKAENILDQGFIEDRVLSSFKKKLQLFDKGLFVFFDTAEKINRGAAYFGAKAQALAKGFTEEEARQIAKKLVRDTQFTFGSIDTPVALQSDIVKTLAQFQTFTIKQIEFLTEMAKKREYAGLVRYIIAGLVFTYTIGKAFGMKPEQIIPSFRFDTPASLKLPVELVKAGLNAPDKYGKSRDFKKKLSDIGKSGITLIPAGVQTKKTIEGLKSVKEGGSFDKSGKLQFQQGQSTIEKVQSGLFGKYASKNAQNYFSKDKTKAKEQAPIKKIYDQVQVLAKEGKITEAEAIVEGLSDAEYEIYKDIRSAQKTKDTNLAKQQMLPTVLKIQKLVSEGKQDEAEAIVNDMTDEEYRIYQLAKKQVE